MYKFALKLIVMKDFISINDILIIDELVNDFEFAERIYQAGYLDEDNLNLKDKNLVWADFI